MNTSSSEHACDPFFDRYPRFRSTSVTDVRGHRMDYRYRMLIDQNAHLLRDARVLDLASHDGRWSFAALKAGARHVTGIEARASLVENARVNMTAYGVSPSDCELILGECASTLRELPDRSFDVVLCFGFLYHTLEHFDVLRSIARVCRHVILIDSRLVDSEVPALMLGIDDSTLEGAAVPNVQGRADVVVGVPTRRALELMLQNLGWQARYLDWGGAGFVDWAGVEDYRDRRRFSLVATRLESDGGRA